MSEDDLDQADVLRVAEILESIQFFEECWPSVGRETLDELNEALSAAEGALRRLAAEMVADETIGTTLN